MPHIQRLGKQLDFSARSARPCRPAIETVGDPLGGWRTSPSEAYARNLWDLQEFRGRLYLCHGDAIVNTGPRQVLAFDPSSQAFTQDTVVNEEAVTSLRVFGDRLYVPGPDAVSMPDGALYVRDAIGWRTVVLPDVVHASDVLVHGAELCVAVQDSFNGGAVRCSRDDGATWSEYSTGSFRAVSLFQLGDALHVSSHDVGVQRIEGGIVPVKLEIEGIDPHADVLVTKAVHCGGELVFIAKQILWFNLDHDPMGGRCPTALWKPGTLIVDRFTASIAGTGDKTGQYNVWTGFFVGSSGEWRNMKLSEVRPITTLDRRDLAERCWNQAAQV